MPIPSNMPFYYDWLEISRGWLRPWSTLASWVLVLGFVILGLWQRSRRPLFALGVLFYFSAHFIASNVVGLEMAFEHRNHFALIGAVLFIGSLLAEATRYLRFSVSAQLAGFCVVLLLLSVGAGLRSMEWRSSVSQAKASSSYAPKSARAWSQLCAEYFRLGGGAVVGNSYLSQAVDACEAGAVNADYSVNNAALLVVLKTLQGRGVEEDWLRVHQRMSDAVMTWDNQRAALILTHHLKQGVALDHHEVLKVLQTLFERVALSSFQSANFGYLILNDMNQPEAALPFFKAAIEQSSPVDQFPFQLADEYRQKGFEELAGRIEGWGRDRDRRFLEGGAVN